MKKDEEKKKTNERKRNKGKHIWGHTSVFNGFLVAMEKTRDGGHSVEETVQTLTTTMSLIESAKGVVHKLFAINPHSAQMA